MVPASMEPVGLAVEGCLLGVQEVAQSGLGLILGWNRQHSDQLLRRHGMGNGLDSFCLVVFRADSASPRPKGLTGRRIPSWRELQRSLEISF
jgi:hypothetical protein